VQQCGPGNAFGQTLLISNHTLVNHTLMLSSRPSLFDFATAMGSNDKSSSASGTPCVHSKGSKRQQQQQSNTPAAGVRSYTCAQNPQQLVTSSL
jgi:hypothetical protein